MARSGDALNGFLIGMIMAIVIFFVIWAVGIAYFMFTEPVGLGISLESQEIAKGTKGVMTFTVSNYNLNAVENITVESFIVDSNIEKEETEIDRLAFFKKYRGSYVFDTTYLSKGEYTVRAILEYEGIDEPLDLTLRFKVI